MAIIVAYVSIILLRLDGTAAYSSALLGLASTPSRGLHEGELPTTMQSSVWQRVFRRGKKSVQTLEREAPPTKQQQEPKEPKELWRVMFHNSEYMPDRVARVLARIVPTLDRRAAFELCSRARSVGKVPVVITTSKKEADMYCLAILQQGLTATVEPHPVDGQ